MHDATNPFLDAALRYAALGYRVFPCVSGDKMPLTEHGVLDASSDPAIIEQWWKFHPVANVAVSTAGLLVLDTDGAENPWPADPQRKYDLAAAPLSLTPSGGNHRFFRQPVGKNWRCTESSLAAHVDTRADGGYAVVAPSVLAGGGIYRWAEGLELDVPPERLPEPPPWLTAELDALAADAGPTTGGENDFAGSNLIPDGYRNSTLASLAGTMRRVGMSGTEIAAALTQVNADRCVPPLATAEVEKIATSIARYEPDQIAVALAENHWEQMYADAPVVSAGGNDPGPIPEELLFVPGFIDEVMSYTLRTAPYPERALAFCGALALQALLAGRKVRDASDNRTNLYILGLANSGAGKDHPRRVNQRVLLDAGLAECLGDGFASGEGIEDRLFLHQSALFQTDEIDGLMTKINLGRDVRYEGIMSVLLKMYTSGAALYPMRAKVGRDPGVIDQPCLCVFGTAVPKHYYEALSVKMLTNGFFARMLVVETGKRGRGQEGVVGNLPDSVRDAARWWAEFNPGERNGNLASVHPIPRVVEYTTEASELLGVFRRLAEDEYSAAEDRGDEAGMAIWARANEKARRLALVYACSADRLQPIIDGSGARWAARLIEHQTRRMLVMAGEHVSENDFDAKCKKVVATLRRWRAKHGDAWMPYWQLSRRHPWSDREHEEVRTALTNQRLIEFAQTATGGRHSKQYRLTTDS